MITEVKSLGDSLFDVNGETLSIEEIASTLVYLQDGNLVEDIVNDHSDRSCRFDNTARRWSVDGEDHDQTTMSEPLADLMHELDDHQLKSVIEDNYPLGA